MNILKTHKYASYDGDEVPITEETVEPTEQEFRPFGPQEEQWLEENRLLAASLGMKYGSGGALTPEELDAVLSRWTSDDEEKESGDWWRTPWVLLLATFWSANTDFVGA